MKNKLQHIIALYVVLALVACGESEEARHLRTAAEKKALREKEEAAFKVGVTPTMDCLPVYFLKDSMLYDTTKVDVRLKFFTSHMDCDTALVGGSIQGCVTDLVRATHLMRKGTPLSLEIATNASWKLVTNRRSRLKELSQFSDKMVAMTRHSVTDMMTDEIISRGKQKYPLYKVQINDVFVRLQMLQNNELDAMWLPEPQATVARLQNHSSLLDTEKEGLRMGVLAFRSDHLADSIRYREFVAFKDAYNRACQLINERGVTYYVPLIRKYMRVDDKVIQQLPKMKYATAERPRESDIKKAVAWKTK